MVARRELTSEEIEEIANKKWNTRVPTDSVLYSDAKLRRIVNNLTGPKTKEGKKKALENLRPFISKEERKAYLQEFGMYANALLNDDEREYFRARRDELLNSEEFEIDPTIDLNFVLMVVMDEIILYRQLAKLAEAPTNAKLNKQITETQKRYRANMRALDATREQRNDAVREEERLDSLAEAVMRLQEQKQQRLLQLKTYEQEEAELLHQRRLKAPADIELEAEIAAEDTEDSRGEDDGTKETEADKTS